MAWTAGFGRVRSCGVIRVMWVAEFVLLGKLKARGRAVSEGIRGKEAAVDTILQERCILGDCQQPQLAVSGPQCPVTH